MKKFLLNVYIWPIFFLFTAICVLFALPVVLFYGLVRRKRTLRQVVRHAIRIYGWYLVRVLPFMAPVTLEDRSGGVTTPVIFAANHNSSVDPYLFGMLPFEMAFVTTWPFKIPIYSSMMHLAQYIDANKGMAKLEEQGMRLLAQGCSLILWPEGHRSRDGKIARFRNGAFHLALRSGCPIVPVCIKGSFKLLPPGCRLLSPARVKIVILPPILPAGHTDNPEDVRKLKNLVKASIIAELPREAQRSENLSFSQVRPRRPAHVKDECIAHES